MVGFVLSHRKIWDSPVFKGNGHRVGVWLWMLHTAAWKDTKQVVGSEVITIRRGQLCVSQAQITEATGMARQQLRTFLILLEKTGAIAPQPATKSTKGRTLITICNYDEYQAQQPNANQTPTKSQPTKEQENKGTRKEKEEDTYVSLSVTTPAIDDVSQAVAVYNAAADRAGWPKVQKLSPARRTALRGRLVDAGGVTGWEVALAKAEASSFLTGRTDRPFTATLDFIAKQSNFTKIMEGNYDDRTPQSPQQSGQPTGRGGRGFLDEIVAAARS